MATDDLSPDYSILSGIPIIKDSVSDMQNTFKEKCNVISSNFTTCTFDIRLDTSTAEGKKLEYSVTEFVSDAVTLEQEWDKLDGPAQKDLMSSIIAAISKLQSITLDSDHAHKILKGTPYYCDGKTSLIGDPELGYHSDMKGFLASLAGDATPDKTKFSATSSSDAFVVESQLENVDQVELINADLLELEKHVVFCHDYLEPRNILIKRDGSQSGKWHLAAIIDWEMAGFFPFAYEYG